VARGKVDRLWGLHDLDGAAFGTAVASVAPDVADWKVCGRNRLPDHGVTIVPRPPLPLRASDDRHDAVTGTRRGLVNLSGVPGVTGLGRCVVDQRGVTWSDRS
jgi:hypothetical protein